MKFTVVFTCAAVLLLVNSRNAVAQKLPGVQKSGVFAPANIKTDGKATEWGAFQAYNRATEVFYTMANDNENLYLVVQAIKPDNKADVIGKILSGGITLSIKGKDKKDKPLMVTFPLIDRIKKSDVMLMIRNREANQDSMLTEINRQLESNSKDIGIAGIAEITGPKISVYNGEGIKAVSLVDAKRNWTYELRLPIKYFKQMLDANASFDYKIIVNGVVIPNEPGDMVVVSGRPVIGISIISSAGPGFDAFNPTDLSGSYTLVKQ